MPKPNQPEATRPDPKALFAKFTLLKRGRTRAVTYKTPRDRLLDSLGNQIEIVHLLKEHRDPKQEGHKTRKMFFFDHGYYVVQVKYNSQPLDLLPDADTIQVNSLDEVEEVLNHAITLASAGHFDDQIERIAAELQIPIDVGHLFRREAGRGSGMKLVTIPIGYRPPCCRSSAVRRG